MKDQSSDNFMSPDLTDQSTMATPPITDHMDQLTFKTLGANKLKASGHGKQVTVVTTKEPTMILLKQTMGFCWSLCQLCGPLAGAWASIYFHNCPADSAITIGILVTGCLGVLSLAVTNINRYRIRQLFKQNLPIDLAPKDFLTVMEYCLAIFVIVAFITTSVFVFLNHDVEHQDEKSVRYCHEFFYKTIFIGLIVIYASAALIVSSLCCLICMIGCCAAFWNASTIKEPDSRTDRMKAASGGSFADTSFTSDSFSNFLMHSTSSQICMGRYYNNK
uniref:Uncharacterized protein n=1 Tax=Romanomermis culicivorax TaxID=13658 RepID=A0A915IX30_ROMCU